MNIQIGKIRILIIVFLLCFLFSQVYSDAGNAALNNYQNGKAAAVIIYTEGDNFDVLDSSGNSIGVDPYNAIGSELMAGNIILTYDNTYVEIQLEDSEHIIKIAENTDFRLDKVEAKRENSFKMLYGSIRAKVAKLGAGEQFRVSGNEAIAGVRGTDFGMTVVVPKEGTSTEPFTRIYCFKGVVEVEPLIKEGAEKTVPAIKQIIVKANEMVTISEKNYKVSFSTKSIPEDIIEYWDKHEFRGTPIPLKPAKTKGAVSSNIKVKKENKNEKLKSVNGNKQTLGKDLSGEIKKLKNSRAAYFSTGIILLSVGGLLEVTGILGTLYPEELNSMFPTVDRKLVVNTLAVSGSVSIAVSFLSLLKANQAKAKINRLKSNH